MSDRTTTTAGLPGTFGNGYTCPTCGLWVSTYLTGGHVCQGSLPQPTPQVGWICPKCGAGNAPSSLRCACVPLCVVTLDGDLGTR